MKDIFTTAIGMMLFDDVSISGQTLAGIGVGLLGGMAYSYFSICDIDTKSVPTQVIRILREQTVLAADA